MRRKQFSFNEMVRYGERSIPQKPQLLIPRYDGRQAGQTKQECAQDLVVLSSICFITKL